MSFKLSKSISIACLVASLVAFCGITAQESQASSIKRPGGNRAGHVRGGRSSASHRVPRASGRKSVHHNHATKQHGGKNHPAKATAGGKPKYAYPLEFFMMRAPDYDRTPYPEDVSHKIANSFQCGIADHITPQQLVKADVFHHYPLSGGIFRRRENVKYIILHSTETGPPVPAKNVINGWNSMGRRHPGAQFVVERNGTIYQAVDPEYGTVHVNIFKTLPGINNDNSIGIEMNHTGRQDYPAEQRAAVVRLVTYLQNRYEVTNDNVITHRYAQQGDHTDPVNMDVEAFLSTKEDFRQKALAMKRVATPFYPEEMTEIDAPVAAVYVQIHGPIKLEAANPPVAPQNISLPEPSVSPVSAEESVGAPVPGQKKGAHSGDDDALAPDTIK